MTQPEDETALSKAPGQAATQPEPGSTLPVVVGVRTPAQSDATRRARIGFLAAAAVVLIGVGFFGWWTFVRPAPLVGFASGNGRIEATEVDIATRIAGRVEAVLVQEGDVVAPGDVLARIDVESLEAQLEEADAALLVTVEAHLGAGASLQRQKSLHRLAEKEFERARRLFAADATSETTLDRRRVEFETAAAGLEQTTRQLRQAERAIEVAAARTHRLRIDVDDATLVAPAAGQVLYRLAEPGEVVPAGGRVVSLVAQDDMYMTVFLAERDAARLRVGAEARIHLDGFPDATWPAYVSYVAPKAQFTPRQVETTREREKLVFKVKVQLPERDPDIKPGMRGVATVRIDPQAAWPDALR